MAKIRKTVVRSRDGAIIRYFQDLNYHKYQGKPQNFTLAQKKTAARICSGLQKKGLIRLENGYMKLTSTKPLQIYRIR